ncbi:aldehyde dehydrogenase family protein [Hydrogenophaga sp.]|uniref:aldehyde dehydrogenase family protein n=1 Tax=Hydrogenophaga sp. TaxID=1904254 RepID=UPI00271EC4E7|nr:aldehyde dehydrogenase family protein [Hydrogenophaga sp.]MDO9437238.1 aldehyde dehydrogenase family protein [Hydrogenophaga sp.]
MKHYGKFYIGGEWVDPVQSRTVELINPATEETFATAALGSEDDVDRAVTAAKKALPGFSATSKQERIALFERIVEVVEARQEQIMAGITRELGAPCSMKEQVRGTMTVFRTAIALLKDYSFETRLGNAILRREPIGVVGLITAWNWPVQSLAIKLASALGAGNTVVLKPSEFTPSSAIHLAEALHEAGVPPGVFNLVNGDGPTVGNAICRHPGIAMVSMTGSTKSGILVAEAAAKTVKRVCQELGGKSANLILPDADLAGAARSSVARGFANTSQSCHAPTRILVHKDQKDAFVKLLAEETGKLRVGDPMDPATTMGPVVNKSQFERVQRYIESAIGEGATLVCGGPGRPHGMTQGYFVQPTIFSDVTPDMTIAREEIFGPVLAVLTYADEDEAVALANGTPFGLGAYVFSGDNKKGRAVCERLQAGRVFYNGDPGDLSAPMGGYKQSGNGREVGVFGLEEYCEVKAIFGFQEPVAAL